MKPNFGNKKNKNKAKKANKKASKQAKAAAKGDDVDMAEVPAANGADDNMATDDSIDYTLPDGSAKSKLKGKMEMKAALKAKVKQLKHTRSKLTKMPGANKAAGTKQVNKEIKQLIKAGVDAGKENPVETLTKALSKKKKK